MCTFTMGRKLGLVVVLLPAVVNARPLVTDGTARTFDVVATRPDARGPVFARQVLPAAGPSPVGSRIIYLNPNGVVLRPGDNDSSREISSIVTEPVEISGWDVDQETWDETVECFRDIYRPFDVQVTDDDPGDVPHIEAVFGGSPLDVGLPENVAGVSPFTTDCSVIERSIVFTFTDVLDDDPRVVCEVMAQEVAHSFGLDHEMLPSDPMTYLSYAGERTFQDEMASCGEFDRRMCGINGSVCRTRQNSHALLLDRLGPRPGDEEDDSDDRRSGITHGCNAGGTDCSLLVLLCYVVGHRVARRRTRGCRDRALLQRGSRDREGSA